MASSTLDQLALARAPAQHPVVQTAREIRSDMLSLTPPSVKPRGAVGMPPARPTARVFALRARVILVAAGVESTMAESM